MTRWLTPAGLCISTQFFCDVDSVRHQIAGRGRHLLAPEKAQIGAQGSKPRGDPQTRPVLKNPDKRCICGNLQHREVWVKMPVGNGMKNLTSTSRGDEQPPKRRVPVVFFSLTLFLRVVPRFDVTQRSIGNGNRSLILVGNTAQVPARVRSTEAPPIERFW